MTDPKKPPPIPQRIEADVGRDLRAVGGLFKKLWRFTERAERTVQTATAPDLEDSVIARTHEGAEVLPRCEICGDSRVVGVGRKIPCPACTKGGGR